MTMSLGRSTRTTAFLIVGGAIAAAAVTHSVWSEPMQEQPFATRAVCAGRYDLNIPEGFEIRIDAALLNGFQVTTLGQMDEQTLRTTVETRRRSLEDGETDASGEQTRLRWARENGRTTILASDVVIDIPGVVLESYEVEAYSRQNGTVFKLVGTITQENEADELAMLTHVAVGLRDEDGPGFCLDSGRYPERLDWQVVEAFIHDPDVVGYGMTLSISDGLRAPSDIPDPAKTLSPNATSRQIADQPGYETQIVTPGATGREDGVAIRFTASAGQEAKAGQPFVTIGAELFKDAESADTPPYDTQTSRALWDSILTSLRPRR
jgi:hypothetical protein